MVADGAREGGGPSFLPRGLRAAWAGTLQGTSGARPQGHPKTGEAPTLQRAQGHAWRLTLSAPGDGQGLNPGGSAACLPSQRTGETTEPGMHIGSPAWGLKRVILFTDGFLMTQVAPDA